MGGQDRQDGLGVNANTPNLALPHQRGRAFIVLLRFVAIFLLAASVGLLIAGCDPGSEITYRACDRWPNASVSDVQSELERGTDVNAMLKITDGYSTTPLHIAAKCSLDSSVTALLLKHGAEVNARDTYFQNTPLYEATRNFNLSNPNIETEFITEFIALLLEHGADANAKAYVEICEIPSLPCDMVSTTILYSAAENSESSAVKLLLEHGADPNVMDGHNGMTPLHGIANSSVISYPDKETIRLLLEYGANINARAGWERASALYLMASDASPDLIQLMLTNGADVNAKTYDVGIPLHRAAYNPDPEVVMLLLDYGAHVNAIDGFEKTPLHKSLDMCCHPPNLEVIATLLQRGANPNARNDIGRTPLHEAVVSHNSPELKDIIELLLEHDADINAVDAQRDTPLHLVIYYAGELVRSQDIQVYPVIRLMLERGANPNAKNDAGETPLHKALWLNLSSHKATQRELVSELVDLMLEYGADLNAQSNYGKTPCENAEAVNSSDVIQDILCQ